MYQILICPTVELGELKGSSPKNENAVIVHPKVVPNLYECLCSAEHKGRYYEESGKQAVFSYYASQWCPKTAWLQTFFKWSSFVFGGKEIHTGLELLEGEQMMTEF